MGKYGSGSFEYECYLEKQTIKYALKGKGWNCDTEETWDISREEAEKIILQAYDQAVYTAITSMHHGRALERMLIDRKVKINFEEYHEALQETMRPSEYEYESE